MRIFPLPRTFDLFWKFGSVQNRTRDHIWRGKGAITSLLRDPQCHLGTSEISDCAHFRILIRAYFFLSARRREGSAIFKNEANWLQLGARTMEHGTTVVPRRKLFHGEKGKLSPPSPYSASSQFFGYINGFLLGTPIWNSRSDTGIRGFIAMERCLPIYLSRGSMSPIDLSFFLVALGQKYFFLRPSIGSNNGETSVHAS